MNEVTALLEGAGLDPYLGFLHQVDYGRPSLALDLIEPFRYPVADRLILRLANLRILEADDFHSGGEGHGVFLSPKPVRRFFEEYERWMLDRRKPPEPAPPESGAGLRAQPDAPDLSAEPRVEPVATTGGPRVPGFREAIRTEVEKLCASLRKGAPFDPWRFTPSAAAGEEDAACNTSSATT